jgi:excisionase family DNA binding protein
MALRGLLDVAGVARRGRPPRDFGFPPWETPSRYRLTVLELMLRALPISIIDRPPRDFGTEGTPSLTRYAEAYYEIQGSTPAIRGILRFPAWQRADVRGMLPGMTTLHEQGLPRVPAGDLPSGLLTVTEAQLALRVSRDTIIRRIHDGQLSAVRIGSSGGIRIPAESLRGLLHPIGQASE